MCPIFNRCEDTAVWSWQVQIRFLSVWWMKIIKADGRKRKSN